MRVTRSMPLSRRTPTCVCSTSAAAFNRRTLLLSTGAAWGLADIVAAPQAAHAALVQVRTLQLAGRAVATEGWLG
jgi:hypothetical protein